MLWLGFTVSKYPEPHPEPPDNFHLISLPVSRIERAAFRLNKAHHDSAIYFDRSGIGRFDTENLGILYLAETLAGVFIETYGRQLGINYVSREFIRTRNLFAIESDRPLQLVDLYGSGLAKIGADSELSSGRNYRISRSWSQAIFNHPQKVDGIRFFSRHDNTQLCWGLFERDYQLSEQNLSNLIDYDEQQLLSVLERYEFGSD